MKFEDYLKQIVDRIGDPTTEGIAKKAIDIGFDNLSEKQKYVLQDGISDYIMEECPNCGEPINYEDMEIAIFNGKCSFCQNQLDKIMSE